MTQLAPLYVGAFTIMLCGISAVNSTIDDTRLTGLTVALLAMGVAVSFLMRLAGVSQRTIGWLVSGLTVFALVSSGSPLAFLGGLMEREGLEPASQRSLGLLLEWGTLLFSYSMLSNASVLFAIIPSMALLGLMSSENLNPEMVTYFLGFVLATVFVMGYDGYLARQAESEEASLRPAPIGGPAGVGPVVRSFLALSILIVGCSFLVGIGVSTPLKALGQNVFRAAGPRGGVSLPFYPQFQFSTSDSMQLTGAPPSQSSQPVLTVKSPRAVYLRSATYSTYTGQSWTGAGRGYRELSPSAGAGSQGVVFRVHPESEVASWPARQRVVQQITLEAPGGSEVLAAAEPVAVLGRFSRLGATRGGALRIPPSGPDGDDALSPADYTVVSAVSTATPQQLRAADVWSRPYGDYRSDRMETENRLRLLALKVTARAPTVYDKVAALADYLRANYTYTLEPPLLPEEEDANEFFLFKTKTGYCEHFASALASLCRVLDIPARVAVGYAPGEWDPSLQRWVVRELHAHAWTEVEFGRYGWVTIDPTGGLQAEPSGFFSLRKLWSRLVRMVTSRQFVPQMMLLAMVLLAGYVLKAEAWDRWARPVWRQWRLLRSSTDPAVLLARDYQRMCRALKPLGVERRPSQTPSEFQREVLEATRGDGVALGEPLESMTRLVVQASYSGRQPSGEEVAQGPALVRRVRAGVREVLRSQKSNGRSKEGRNPS